MNLNNRRLREIQREKIESSQAFKKCNKWGGLENLYNHLSETDREVIENRTSVSGSSVTHIIADMIKNEIDKPSFKVYTDSEEIDSNTIDTTIDIGVA